MTEFERKWADAAMGGFQQVPDLLLKNQARLGLSCNDMIVLLHVTMHWWYAGQLPFPATAAISKRIGQNRRTVQRSLLKLRKLELIAPRNLAVANGNRKCWDPSGLVERLSVLAGADPTVRLRQKGRMAS